MSAAIGAPEIPGLTFVRKLGSGGYADVFLYDQAMPARQVAVKVMRETTFSAASADQFRAEADAMARLEHPHIVPVYSVGTTVDGRQYIVMMFYPKASLSERAKRERFSVAEVLRIGIQVGSGLETAHRAGILHRDIKPANILSNKYGSPGLTDFGIAAQISNDPEADTGVSVPWSPPEVLYATAPASVRSDVYSLAATLWHLLVGRSPFEIPGGDNSQFALMRRIRDSPPPSTGRPDVPASLDNLLRTAMSPNPTGRPTSMLTFLRSLQSIEQDLRFPRTPITLADDRLDEATPGEQREDATRLRPAAVTAPQSARPAQPPGGPRPSVGDPVVVAAGMPERTRLRQAQAAPPAIEPADEPKGQPRWWIAIVAVVVVGLIVAIGVWLNSSTPPAVTPPATGAASRPPDGPQVGAAVAPPGKLTFTAVLVSDTQMVLSWTYDPVVAGDWFQWRWRGEQAPQRAEAASVTLAAADAKPGACVEVRVIRASSGAASEYFAHCFA